MSGSQKQTTKTKSEPWSAAQPALKDIAGGAQDWMGSYQDRPLFQGSTVQGFDPAQQQALQGTEQRAQQGSPLVGQAQDYTSDVLSGQYLEEGNPHFNRLSESIRRQVMPGVNQSFSAAGRSGSPANQYHLTKAMGDAIAPIAYQDYQNQMGRMDQAAQMAPQLAREDYFDLQQLYGAGQQRQQQGQAELMDEVQRHYQEQQRPLTAMQEAANLAVPIGGLGGTQTGTTTQSSSANPLTTAVGGLMTVGNLFNPLGGFF